MASLFHFPTSHKLFLPSQTLSPSICIRHNHHFFLICRSKSKIYASIKKSRASRKVKSNDDLCNDIREFLSSVGLPEDHVPTMKELSQNGRQDLANIVRRRGYKFVKELLLTSKQPAYECIGEDGLVEKSEDGSLDGKIADMAHDVSLPSEASAVDSYTNDASNDLILNSDEQNSGDQEFLGYSFLEEKVVNFIQNGELDSIEGSGFEIFQREGSIEGQNGAKILSGSPIAQSIQHDEHPSMQSSLMRNDSLSAEYLTMTEGISSADTEPHNMEIQAEINHLKFVLHQKELELTQLKQQIEEEKRLLSVLQIKAETEIREAERLISEKDAELNAAEDSLSGLKEVEIQYRAEGENVEVAGSFNGWHHKIKMDPQESPDPIGEDIQSSSDIVDPIGDDIQASSVIVNPIGMREPRLWKTVLWATPQVIFQHSLQLRRNKVDQMSHGEIACTYACLILNDEDIPITAEKISTLVKTANVTVEPYWPLLFAKLAEKKNLGDLIMNVGAGGGGGAAVSVAAPVGGAAAAAAPAAEEKKEEPKEESDDDMGFSLFD